MHGPGRDAFLEDDHERRPSLTGGDPLRPAAGRRAYLRPDLGPAFPSFTALLVAGMGLLALVRALGSLLMLHGISVVRDYEITVDADTQSALDSTDQILSLYAGIAGPVELACVVAFLGWQYLMARSSAVDPRSLRRRPRWHVLAFFTPVLGLWWPAQNLRDVYAGALATRWPTGQAPHVGRMPLFIGGWWALRLFTVWLTHLALIFSTTATGPVQVRQTLGLLAVAFAAGVPSAIAAAYAIVRITTSTGIELKPRLRT